MRAKVKMIIDAGMMILVLLQMAYHLIGDSLHERLGILLFILLILHNILDRKWYSGLLKGRYTPIRFFHTAVNILLLASFTGAAVSAVFLSTTLSTFFHLNAAMIGRRMHMVFTTWSFVLMSAHAGLHWSRRISAIKKQPQGVQYLFWILVILLSGYGAYAFISRGLLQRMLFLTEYVFFDYEELFICIIIDYLSVLCLFSLFTYGISRLITKKISVSR